MAIKKSVLIDLLDSDLDHDQPHVEIDADGLLLKCDKTLTNDVIASEVLPEVDVMITAEDIEVSSIANEETLSLKSPVEDKVKGLQKNNKKQKRN